MRPHLDHHPVLAQIDGAVVLGVGVLAAVAAHAPGQNLGTSCHRRVHRLLHVYPYLLLHGELAAGLHDTNCKAQLRCAHIGQHRYSGRRIRRRRLVDGVDVWLCCRVYDLFPEHFHRCDWRKLHRAAAARPPGVPERARRDLQHLFEPRLLYPVQAVLSGGRGGCGRPCRHGRSRLGGVCLRYQGGRLALSHDTHLQRVPSGHGLVGVSELRPDSVGHQRGPPPHGRRRPSTACAKRPCQCRLHQQFFQLGRRHQRDQREEREEREERERAR
mmetsp:Transcript_37814/g.114221  ORF Transcript_37814/g.114221 Transcript_37814/m.114221 type:complete len:272 (-) Transcript_37814:414-1229(-)